MLLTSFVFLSVVEKKETDLDRKNIWMLYFQNPKDTLLDFAIKNHSNNPNFHWEIFVNKIKVKEGDVEVPKGETKNIPVSAKDITDMEGKKITITVTQGESKKEIYKNF